MVADCCVRQPGSRQRSHQHLYVSYGKAEFVLRFTAFETAMIFKGLFLLLKIFSDALAYINELQRLATRLDGTKKAHVKWIVTSGAEIDSFCGSDSAEVLYRMSWLVLSPI